MPKLETMEKQLADLQKKIDAEKQRLKAQKAKEKKRMIEIVGAYYLDKASKNGTIQQLAADLDQGGLLKKKADRNLFGLGETQAQNPQTQPPSEKSSETDG